MSTRYGPEASSKTDTDLPDAARPRMLARGVADSIAIRFWGLAALVFFLSVASVSVAVRMSATPKFAELQSDTIALALDGYADHLDDVIGDFGQFLQILASTPKTRRAAVGNLTSMDLLKRQWTSVTPPEGLRLLELYDVLEDDVARVAFPGKGPSAFTREWRRDLALQVLASDAPPEIAAVKYVQNGDEGHFLVAVPVLKEGFTEGVLIGEFDVNWGGLFADRAGMKIQVLSSELLPPVQRGEAEPMEKQVGAYGVIIRLYPDRAKTAVVGQQMLEDVLTAVAFVLLIPFIVFAWSGRRMLVLPHLALRDSERLLMAQKRELAELAAVAEKANDSILVTDLAGKVVWSNPAFEAMSGYSIDEIRGRAPGEVLQGPETDPETVSFIRKSLMGREPVNVDLLNYRRDGRAYWVSLSISPLRDADGAPQGFMAISRDVTEARRQKQELLEAHREIKQQALQDALTRLPNRRALDDELSRRVLEGGLETTLIRVDLDKFKYVNDTLGHAAGDQVLLNVANILRASTRTHDLPVRVGGDEFVVLLPPGDGADIAWAIAERLREAICRPMRIQKRQAQIGASFGVASTLDGLVALEEILVAADAALYAAKENGRNRIEHYTEDMHCEVVARRELADDIRMALVNDEFVPFFQPQVDAETNQVVGIETLVRWVSPKYGMMAPFKFLPTAERLSILHEIDALVMEKAFDAVRALQQKGLEVPKVALNVTLVRLEDPRVLDRVREHKPDGVKVAFEVLESALIDNPSQALLMQLARLREAGVQLEMDDFGSGHASLIAVREASPDTIKIDRRLVFPITSSAADQQIVRSIIDIGRALDIHVIAEGVETLEHARILRDLGCHTLQGYYFARPMPLDDLEEYLKARQQGGGPCSDVA